MPASYTRASSNLTYMYSEREQREGTKEKIFEEVMVNNFLNLMKTINRQIQKAHELHLFQLERDHGPSNAKGPLNVRVVL